jgi:hypothetical protein
MSKNSQKSPEIGKNKKLGAPTIQDNFLVGLRNAWIMLLEESWPDIGRSLRAIRNKQTAKAEDIRTALLPLTTRRDGALASPLFRENLENSEPRVILRNRKRLGKLNDEISKQELELDQLLSRCREVGTPLLVGDQGGEESLESETARRYTQLVHDSKQLWMVKPERDALEELLTRQEAYVFQFELLDYLHSTNRYAVEPRQLAGALAGLPTMKWRQSYVRCSAMPYKSEPHLWYRVFKVVDEICEQLSKEEVPDFSVEAFRMKVVRLPKTLGHLREFLWKNWRDLRLAIEECCKTKVNRSELPFAITRFSIQNFSQQKSLAERILVDREKICKHGA